MSSVMIQCPMTGEAVSTHIEAEPGVFRHLPNIPSLMHCSACGQDHVWTADHAWLKGEPRLVEVVIPRKTAAA